MMKNKRLFRRILTSLAACTLCGWLIGCAPLTARTNQQIPTRAALAVITPPPSPTTVSITSIPTPTNSPPPTTTPLPTTTATPTQTLTPTATATETPLPIPTVPVGRICPDPSPLKPPYARNFLPNKVWAKPNSAIAEPHFWLGRPLPGTGRQLINQDFPYGWDADGRLLFHNGVDIAEQLGMPLLAVADGTVLVAQSDLNAWYGWRCDWYGHLVVLELDQRWQGQPVYALYGHVLNINVEPGQHVVRGEQVAEIGFGGAALSPHLHFEVRVGSNEFGSTRNPMLWLDPGGTRGVIVGRLIDPLKRPWQGVTLDLLGQANGVNSGRSWSYLGDPQQLANPDEGWAENFVFSDVRPGEYTIHTTVQGVEYRASVSVQAGQISTIEIITGPFKTATPESGG